MILSKFTMLCMGSAAYTFWACSEAPPESSSKVKSNQDSLAGYTSSSSCDLQETGKASDAASKKALECAYNSLKAAGKLSGPGIAADFVEIVDGSRKIYEGTIAASELISDLKQYIESEGVNKLDSDGAATDAFKSADAGKVIIEESALGKSLERKAMYKCLAGQYLAAKSLYKLTQTASQISGQKISARQISDLASIGLTSAVALLEKISTSADCLDWISQKRTKDMVKLSEGAKTLANTVRAYAVVAQCGVDLAEGGYVLAKNSACLVGDLQNLFQSNQNVESQRDNYIESTQVPQNTLQNGRDACMTKYGLFLQRQTFYSYASKSNKCGDYCGNNGFAGAYMKENLREIYPRNDDYAWCSANATSAMNQQSITSCVTFCCNQEGQCTTDALKRAGF
ncbi:MAG: hypothetical protein NT027_10765 [Proteobacteria bacterium]|nr:hypothetical protein [Pseudomonadota bacterium]